ncbi:hypothetical protein K438DRAFT_1760870 [Mycena galopus ATCC 62051]|nr:hypothetical protein K438DRAFT_1760870 [Mycena galopus ATCC 62051]
MTTSDSQVIRTFWTPFPSVVLYILRNTRPLSPVSLICPFKPHSATGAFASANSFRALNLPFWGMRIMIARNEWARTLNNVGYLVKPAKAGKDSKVPQFESLIDSAEADCLIANMSQHERFEFAGLDEGQKAEEWVNCMNLDQSVSRSNDMVQGSQSMHAGTAR